MRRVSSILSGVVLLQGLRCNLRLSPEGDLRLAGRVFMVVRSWKAMWIYRKKKYHAENVVNKMMEFFRADLSGLATKT